MSVDSEGAGTNCAAGGVAVHAGLDADNDGELEAAEVSVTRYVCNGTSGATGSMGVGGAMGSQGPAGQQGPSGEPGAPGTAGAPGAAGFGMAWLDSGGQVLARARGAFPALYFDSSGFIWVLNPSDGQLGPFRDGGLYRIYESSDCSGTEYIGPLPIDMPAGATFRRQPDGELFARKFDSVALTVGACSNRGFNGGVCNGVSPCPDPTLVIRASDVVVATPPTLPLQPPFHLSINP